MNVTAMQAAIEDIAANPKGARGWRGRAIDAVVDALDRGKLRVCELQNDRWITHVWLKQAILLYFQRHDAIPISGDDLAFFDKIPTKKNFARIGVRCVPPAVARYGCFLGPDVILMPSFVNIGAYVDSGTMVDTWATVGSCAQIGKNVHLSGGVGIGGVLEPPQAQPVIVEDGAFVGSRCIIVEGVHVEREAVLGAGVVLTASTPIVDVRGAQAVTSKGKIPARAVVIPGTLPKDLPAGTFGTPCALIIGTRSESTDQKTSLNAVLRDYEIAV